MYFQRRDQRLLMELCKHHPGQVGCGTGTGTCTTYEGLLVHFVAAISVFSDNQPRARKQISSRASWGLGELLMLLIPCCATSIGLNEVIPIV